MKGRRGLRAAVLPLLLWILAGADRATAEAANTSARTRKILFLGDSISYGMGASTPEQRFTTRVVSQLNAGGGRFEEVNLAIRGSTLVDHDWPEPGRSGYPYRLARALRERPDVVVIQYGTNDNAFGLSLGRFLASYRDAVREIRASLPDTKIVCMTISPSWDTLNSDEAWLNAANVGIQEIGALEGAFVAQSHAALRNRRERFPDGIHPDDVGHHLLAGSVSTALERNAAPSCERFDLAFSGPGRHRICGYAIEAHAQPSASQPVGSATGGSDSGWVEIRGLSLDGFDYRSDYPLTIATGVRTCRKAPVATIRLASGSTQQLTGRREDWCGAGSYSLPPSPHAIATVTIRR
jgi:lysophospholipase L1-like esterase